MCDPSSVDVDAVDNSTVKSPPIHAPGPTTYVYKQILEIQIDCLEQYLAYFMLYVPHPLLGKTELVPPGPHIMV